MENGVSAVNGPSRRAILSSGGACGVCESSAPSGGAVYMNAGAYDGTMAGIVQETEFVDGEGNICTLKGDEHGFDYRTSVFRKHPDWTVLRSTMQLQNGDSAAILDKMNDFAQRRRDKQPLNFPSAGSTFKRPVGHFAGQLIEQALAELDAEAAALEQARAEAETAVQQAADAKAALDAQQAALQATQCELETALLDANSALTAQQAATQAQAAVTDAAKKAYEAATAALDAYVRAQSQRYTTADLHLTSLAFRCPLDSYGRITTQFGEPDPWGIPHRGTDFAAPGGTPIYAIADGVVSAARTMNSYGNCVQVSHGTADDGHCYDSLYAHMCSIAVAQGDTVQKGDLLGYVGNTGNVYGAGGGYHLHLELRVDGGRVNPLGYVPTL